MSKILITSGCSFSECSSGPVDLETWTELHHATWPQWLACRLKSHGFHDHVSKAMGSQGNGLISRGTIYAVCQALKTHQPEDILVGVMWSGSSRHDYICENPQWLSFRDNPDPNWMDNPTGFVDGAEPRWVIMNHDWTNTEAATYYSKFHSFTGDTIYSLEHILRTQYFLKSKGVNYFFTNFVDNNIVDFHSEDYRKHQDQIDYLYELIDFNNYLPVSSELTWVHENSIYTDSEIHQHGPSHQWLHPESQQHREFSDQVIYPYLLDRGYI